MIVVDTSVLAPFFRGDDTPGAWALTRLEEDGVPFVLPSLCCQELLARVTHEEDWYTLADHLATQRLLTPKDPDRTHYLAARIAYDIRRDGLPVPSPRHCLIAQMVLDEDGVLLEEDQAFQVIAKVRELRVLQGERS